MKKVLTVLTRMVIAITSLCGLLVILSIIIVPELKKIEEEDDDDLDFDIFDLDL